LMQLYLCLGQNWESTFIVFLSYIHLISQ
jgi:hypothetical protein